jgi:predicted  nucleic acid-binding Zn-ribbon protein
MDEARRAVSEVEAGVADEVRDLSGRIRELTAERQGLVQQLDRTVAADYDRIGRSRNGKVVVAVKDGTCQGCFMGVTRQMIARLWSKKELLHCPNCARLMYLEGEVE